MTKADFIQEIEEAKGYVQALTYVDYRGLLFTWRMASKLAKVDISKELEEFTRVWDLADLTKGWEPLG